MDDVILYALPMCAPYEVVRDYKYKVKIIPGNQKRGKACSQAMTYYLHNKEITAREKEVMKNISTGELAMNMISNVKLVMPGANINIKGKASKQKHRSK